MSKITQKLVSKTETEITINWSSDTKPEYVSYSIDNGASWVGSRINYRVASGTFTIKHLQPNTEYKIITDMQTPSGFSEASPLYVTTYDYPHCTYAPSFRIGDEVTLEFYNPLNRTFDFTIYGYNNIKIFTWPERKGTQYKGVDGEPAVTNLYNSIPDRTSASYEVEVTYGTSSRVTQGGKYIVYYTESQQPQFSSFTYKDTQSSVVAVTGNDQILVEGLSTLAVEISSAQKMVAKNGATPYKYVASIDDISKDINYATGDVGDVVGTVTGSGQKTLRVTAFDSRGFSRPVNKRITVLPYSKPHINVSIERVNKFEAQTTLSVNGTYSKVTLDSVDKNQLQAVQYRYRETGGTWSNWFTLTTTITSGKFACNNVELVLDNSKSFEFEIKASDKLNSSVESVTVDIGQAIFFISSNKKTCYLNGKEIAVAEDVPALKSYIAIPDNTDLNDIVTIGTYRSTAGTHTKTMSNYPPIVDGGFKLIVSGWTGNADYTTGLRQDLYFTNTHFVRRTLDGGATWGVWRQIAYIDNIVDTTYPVGSVYITTTNTNPNTILGRGTWSLISKDFTSSSFENTQSGNDYLSIFEVFSMRTGQSVRLKLKLKTSVALNDTETLIGTLDLEDHGIQKVNGTYFSGGIIDAVAISDGGNATVSYKIDTAGNLYIDECLNLDGTHTLKANSWLYINEIITTTPSRMIDSFCDRFYWKRTA